MQEAIKRTTEISECVMRGQEAVAGQQRERFGREQYEREAVARERYERFAIETQQRLASNAYASANANNDRLRIIVRARRHVMNV